MNEWTKTGEKIIPYSIRKNDYKNFEYYLENLEVCDKDNIASAKSIKKIMEY